MAGQSSPDFRIAGGSIQSPIACVVLRNRIADADADLIPFFTERDIGRCGVLDIAGGRRAGLNGGLLSSRLFVLLILCVGFFVRGLRRGIGVFGAILRIVLIVDVSLLSNRRGDGE